MFERKHQPPVSRAEFTRRLAWHGGAAVALLMLSLGGGMLGYMTLEVLSPLDAFLNAAMLLGGMGPVDRLQTTTGKWLAGSYALFAGLVFIVLAGVMLAPVIHAVLHRFHLESGQPRAEST